MPENIYIRALIVVAVAFIAVQGTAWLIRQIYFVINDLDNWAIWMLRYPTSAAGFAIVAGVVYLVVSKSLKKE
ncbi:hypothetical protein [Pseudanabaena yagii]|uniref:Uncharacterized protein n=1 Tax=Pseudanabaena yagii GIHE-NHR1 TaxID=2722753 RepID=A0ABX1M223_9CYAN|nr:hypothetical protein [Pseudanabaena yagii]NMF60162.1 hypothetical protein [Pseudanabaena yagii GIHE-NHR1]